MTQPLPRVAIVGGARTPFAKAGGAFRHLSALDLSVHAVDGLLARANLDPATVGEFVWGAVIVDPRLPHLARETVLQSALDPATRALTVTDNCISGASAAVIVHDAIRLGRAEIGIAGGAESLSNPALLFRERAARVFLEANASRSTVTRVGRYMRLRPRDFVPAVPGAVEPSTGLTMGEHCELMVKEWQIERAEQDAIALRSHQRAHAAAEAGHLRADIVPLDGVGRDLTVRADTSVERLAALRPAFDSSGAGTITAGNASPLTDGAAALLLMSEDRARREGVTPLAFIRDVEFAGVDPNDGLLMAPGVAVPRLLRRAGLTLEEIDVVEVHEAFAAQVACNLRAWREGWREPAAGAPRDEALNPTGGSIALGHPFAATGARILLSLARTLARQKARFGLASICGAGATAAAVLLERDALA